MEKQNDLLLALQELEKHIMSPEQLKFVQERLKRLYWEKFPRVKIEKEIETEPLLWDEIDRFAQQKPELKTSLIRLKQILPYLFEDDLKIHYKERAKTKFYPMRSRVAQESDKFFLMQRNFGKKILAAMRAFFDEHVPQDQK